MERSEHEQRDERAKTLTDARKGGQALKSVTIDEDWVIPEVSDRFVLHAYSTAKQIPFRAIQESLPGIRAQRVGRDGLCCFFGESQFVFFFRFGAVVFFNVPVEEHAGLFDKLGAMGRAYRRASALDDELSHDHFILIPNAESLKFGFDRVSIPELSFSRLQIIVHLMAQSCALEILEWEVDEFLKESHRYTSLLRKVGGIRISRREVARFLGDGLHAKHRILRQLSLLSEPERTWEREDLYKIYLGLWETFDFSERLDLVEKSLSLSTEVSQLLLEILHSRRAELLEWIIILLIAIEVVRPFISPHR